MDGGIEGVVGTRGGPEEPRALSFRQYARTIGSDVAEKRSSRLGVVVGKPLLSRLTKDIVNTYQSCNPNFKHNEELNPKRYLTTPHIGVQNDGFDNANSDLILSVNFVLINEETKQRYIVKKMLGQGTFGQVVKCWIPETDSYVAIKVIKNQPAYYHQAVHEVNILRTLNRKYDPDDKYHIVRMLEYFVYQRHLCISFEKLGSNLFELLRMNQLKGLSLNLIQMFSKQMLQALMVMKDAGIIHCDLKPENVLLCASVKPPRVKIIDFGSACMEGHTVYSYIQSRYYRSPEVVLGYPYTTSIDMWSFGCMIAELFLGLPLFPGISEYDLLRRMITVIGGQPPDNLLRDAKNTNKFFKHVGSIHYLDSHGGLGSHERACAYNLLSEEEYEAREQKKPAIGKWYFGSSYKLSDIINEYPFRKNLSEEELTKEKAVRSMLIDFLGGLVEFNPEKRWTPLQASGHPFITGGPFTGPYNPPATTSHIPVSRHITVDQGPGQGHWLAAGLSPQVSNTSRGLRHSSPHVSMTPLTHGGSLGSYSETTSHRGSYGSYGDSSHMFGYFSPGGRSGLGFPIHFGGSNIGTSPDARAVPFSVFTLSPTRTFGPMSLGGSPSQFTPPSSQIQVSNISPGKYGPTSPARSSAHGSPLGKAAALGQYNRKRNLCHPGTAPVQLPEGASQHWHGHQFDGAMSSYPEVNSRGSVGPRTVGSSHQSGWTKQRGSACSFGSSAIMFQSLPPSHPGSLSDVLHSSESSSDQAACSSSIPHPGDWDPNYSDDLLLQETSDIDTVTSGVSSMHLRPWMPCAASVTDQRFDESLPNAFSRTDIRESDADISTSLNHIHPGQSHPIMAMHQTHLPPSSSSRFRQAPAHQHSNFQSVFMHDERNNPNGQFSRRNYSMLDAHNPTNSAFGSGTSWGYQTGHPFVPILPRR